MKIRRCLRTRPGLAGWMWARRCSSSADFLGWKSFPENSMQCICYSRFGGPEVLELCDVELPEPGPGQVRLRVAGAGVNPIDYKTRAGLGFAAQALGTQFQFTPGYDVAGMVDATGAGVTEPALGDAGFGMVNFPLLAGAYAEFVVLAAADVVPAPARLP